MRRGPQARGGGPSYERDPGELPGSRFIPRGVRSLRHPRVSHVLRAQSKEAGEPKWAAVGGPGEGWRSTSPPLTPSRKLDSV